MGANPDHPINTPHSGHSPSQGQRPSARSRWLCWPATKPGWWALWLLAGFAAFLALFFLLVNLGERGGETFFANLRLSLLFLAAAASALAGGVAALFAVLLRGERSLLVFLSLLVSLLVLIFLLGEILSPH